MARPARIRPKSGAWSPLVDMVDVFPGHRGRSRHGEIEAFDAPTGIGFEVEEAAKSEPLLEAERPWEKDSVSPLCVWQEDGRYHMLYDAAEHQCHAISDDGYDWTRPELGEVEFDGSRKNNLLASPCKGATGTFEDPSAPADQRYKAMGGKMAWHDPDTGEPLEGEEPGRRVQAAEDGGKDYTGPRAEIWGQTLGWISPDRLHWTPIEEPLAERPVNGGIAARYDEHRREYFAYIQLMGYPAEAIEGIGTGGPELGTQIRTLGFTRTPDFGRWPAPKMILHPDQQDEPDISFYGGNYFTYPGRDDLHGMLIPIFHQIADTIDGQIAFSRDGLFWSRPERRAILPTGVEGDGDECIAHFWRSGLVELPDGHWACPYTGNSVLHCVGKEEEPELFPSRRPTQIRWALWRPHRLCGVRAAATGSFTVPTLYRAQDQLRLNYRCEPGGWVEIELLENVPSLMFPDGDAVTGFGFEECDRLTGDSEDRIVTWDGRSDISAIGDTVALRVRLFGAKLFAYRV